MLPPLVDTGSKLRLVRRGSLHADSEQLRFQGIKQVNPTGKATQVIGMHPVQPMLARNQSRKHHVQLV
jgi:hypothetical protein